MRLASTAHASHPWLIHDIAPDFRVEDVWALPTPGGPDGFPDLVATLRTSDFENDGPWIARMVWNVRRRLGALLGWDNEDSGLDVGSPSLRHRLPQHLHKAAESHPADARSPFTFLYETHDEFAQEIANRTIHAVLHLSWVPDGEGGWRGQMAVLVRTHGILSSAYMAGIKPFRHLIVYPALLRTFERRWQERWEQGTRS